jgi:hypothetical protein
MLERSAKYEQDRLLVSQCWCMEEEESDDSVDALAGVSKDYSRWSTKRAQIIGQYKLKGL